MGNYKPLVNVLFVEGPEEYYFSWLKKFYPTTGKADLDAAWRDESGVEPITIEFQTGIDPIRIESFPCCLPNVGVKNQNVIHMPDPDPRTWQIGNLISKNQDGTVTYSTVDPVNAGQLITQTSIPQMVILNAEGTKYYYPLDFFKISDEVADYFAANWGPVP